MLQVIRLISTEELRKFLLNSDKQEEENAEVDEEDSNMNASAAYSGHPLERRKRSSKLRHRNRDAPLDEIEMSTPAPEKLTEREIIQKILLTNEYDWRVRPVGLNNTFGGNEFLVIIN